MDIEEVIPGYYLCKLSTGVAYYLVYARLYDKWHIEYNGQSSSIQRAAHEAGIVIEHLLSVGSKWCHRANKVLIINWRDMPKTYQLDAMACRPEIREKYYESIYGHKPNEVKDLKTQLFAVVKDMSDSFMLFKHDGGSVPVDGEAIPTIVPIKSTGGYIASYPLTPSQSYNPCTGIFMGDCEAKTEQTIVDNTQTQTMDLLNNIPGMNLSYGKLAPGLIALSMTGDLAFKTKDGGYVTIQTEGTEKTRIDVGSLKLDVDFYKVPTQTLKEGDVILLDNEFLIVGKKTSGDWKFINPVTGASTNKLQRDNVLGMYFYTKVVSMFSMVGGEGNGLGLDGLDPTMLMLLSGQGGQLGIGGGSGDIGQLLVLSQLAKAKGGGDLSNILPLLMMSGGNGGTLNGGGIGQLLLMQTLVGNGGGSSLFGKKRVAAKAPVAKKKVVKKKTTAKSKD